MIARGCKCGKDKKSERKNVIASDIVIGHEFDNILSLEDIPDAIERICECKHNCHDYE